MQNAVLELKGSSFTLSVLHINSKDLDRLLTELDAKLAQAPQFFVNAPLVLNLAKLADDLPDLAALKQALHQRNLFVVGLTGIDSAKADIAAKLQLPLMKSGKDSKNTPAKAVVPARSTKIVKQNVRSGQQIYAANADLIVFGAVSNGAEVIADGSIHVYGTLRGKAMAGAQGDNHAVIIAKTLSAELVSIAGNYWLSDSIQEHTNGSGACVRLDGESLIIESLPL
ncbi:septum site-determining protein MinC [Shewanella sp. C32]|uniref:Probable septum site-determining protein MinC n=1 Tax=Shewanella electrica TaxID=515560 RepID=A0ABT2FSI4_9GAMM|nr:septum site-determining protein MinC [Shewanella electrica]MCH1927015.1 septum site-determining protein MinC [Shewanella electrica]MCS4558630.1 septum site-determining protein MinC [Shewanella electrica]